MPELPEVETVVTQLNKKIINKTIKSIDSDHPKMVVDPSFNEFKKQVLNQSINKIKRRGKNIFIELKNAKTIWIHLKMTGHLLYKPKKPTKRQIQNFNFDSFNQYIHFSFIFSDDTRLDFSDLRKFGRIKLIQAPIETIFKNLIKFKLDNLGSEPFDKNLTFKKFKNLIKYSISINKKSAKIIKKPRTKEIKEVILDQSVIAGIGNIYASEILFDAEIKPTKKAIKLSDSEIKKLLSSTRKILKKAIINRGTSVSDFRDTEGEKGKNAFDLKVYRKTGIKCTNCDKIILRIKQGQRSTFYCPKCQK